MWNFEKFMGQSQIINFCAFLKIEHRRAQFLNPCKASPQRLPAGCFFTVSWSIHRFQNLLQRRNKRCRHCEYPGIFLKNFLFVVEHLWISQYSIINSIRFEGKWNFMLFFFLCFDCWNAGWVSRNASYLWKGKANRKTSSKYFEKCWYRNCEEFSCNKHWKWIWLFVAIKLCIRFQSLVNVGELRLVFFLYFMRFLDIVFQYHRPQKK